MSRERFWGLYDYRDGRWMTRYGWCTGPGDVIEKAPRNRFPNREEALDHARKCGGEVVPRPFYVVRKPKKADGVAEAAKRLRDAIGATHYSWLKQQPEVRRAWEALNKVIFQ